MSRDNRSSLRPTSLFLASALALASCKDTASEQRAAQQEANATRALEEAKSLKAQAEAKTAEAKKESQDARAMAAETKKESEDVQAKELAYQKRTATPDATRIKNDLIGKSVSTGFVNAYNFENLDEFLKFDAVVETLDAQAATFKIDTELRKYAGRSDSCLSKLEVKYVRADADDRWRFASVKAKALACE